MDSNGTPQKTLQDTLKAYLSSRKEVVAAFLFGSYAHNRQRPDSDVDVAVLLTPAAAAKAGEIRTGLMVELGRALRKDVHPVIMNSTGEELLKQIFSRGTCLQVNDERSYASFRIAAYCRIADFAHYRQLAQRGLIHRLKQEARGA